MGPWSTLPSRDFLNRGKNADVRAAAAEVAAHVFANLVRGARVAFPDARNRGHDLARRAIPALQGVVIDEGLLHGVQRAGGSGHAFDGGDLPVVGLHGKREARHHAPTVDVHRARAALTVVTPLL